MVIAANKVRGVRAVAPFDLYSAKMSRVDNDSNVLGLRGRKFSSEKAKNLLGWEASYSIEQGLKETIPWYVKYMKK